MTVSLNNVRFLRDAVIEQKAWNLLYKYGEGVSREIKPPIPVEHIAENFLGYQIEITVDGMFSDPDLLGGIIFEENLIQINGAIETQNGRFNFTVSHEIGHHFLHKDWLKAQQDQQNLFSALEVPKILCREKGLKPRGELQADKFAASLLMPEQFVKAAYYSQYKKIIDVSIRPHLSTLPLIPNDQARHIAEVVIDEGEFTNVSKIAMVNRLLNLGLITGIGYQKSESTEYVLAEEVDN
jgi:Zn-dependent peptidase ImmA (M78 family)